MDAGRLRARNHEELVSFFPLSPLAAAKRIKPKVIIPMHNRDVDPEEFKVKCEASTHTKVVPLQIGEICQLN